MDKLSRKGFFSMVAGLFAAPVVVKAMPEEPTVNNVDPRDYPVLDTKAYPFMAMKDGKFKLYDGSINSTGWVVESVSCSTDCDDIALDNGTILRVPSRNYWTATVVNPGCGGYSCEIEITQEQATGLLYPHEARGGPSCRLLTWRPAPLYLQRQAESSFRGNDEMSWLWEDCSSHNR